MADEGHTSVERLLVGLRTSYLEELPEKCDNLESLALQLGQQELFSTSFSELYRVLHSMKGGTGTLGLSQLSNVCHQFEDALHLCEGDAAKVTATLVDGFLSYIDLLRSIGAQYRAGTVDNKNVAHSLQTMRDQLFPANFHGLYVDTSKLGVRLCQEAFASSPVKLTIAPDGMAALDRLLQQKFDFLITSRELPRLNAVGLMSAVRLSSHYNANIKSILITSKEQLDLPQPNLFNVVIKKDNTIAVKLRQALEQLLGVKC